MNHFFSSLQLGPLILLCHLLGPLCLIRVACLNMGPGLFTEIVATPLKKMIPSPLVAMPIIAAQGEVGPPKPLLYPR